RAVAELCRVASRLVVVDYPSATSLAGVQAVARRAAYALGARTEPYRVFTSQAIEREFANGGFVVAACDRQFVLPIALHKALRWPAFTRASRRVSDRLGLLRVFGSPVTIAAARQHD